MFGSSRGHLRADILNILGSIQISLKMTPKGSKHVAG